MNATTYDPTEGSEIFSRHTPEGHAYSLANDTTPKHTNPTDRDLMICAYCSVHWPHTQALHARNLAEYSRFYPEEA